jgi:fumarate reductase subunit C
MFAKFLYWIANFILEIINKIILDGVMKHIYQFYFPEFIKKVLNIEIIAKKVCKMCMTTVLVVSKRTCSVSYNLVSKSYAILKKKSGQNTPLYDQHLQGILKNIY